MRKVTVFNSISVDGFFADAAGNVSWAHRHDEEWTAFSSGNASGAGELLLGRVTYDMMAAFWPTEQAAQMLPAVAAGMNAMRKYVASRTLTDASWQHTTVLAGDLTSEVRRLKQQPGPDLVILGSGSIVSQLTAARLVDLYQLVLVPVLLGNGRTLFETIPSRHDLRCTDSRSFKNGNIVVWYEPA